MKKTDNELIAEFMGFVDGGDYYASNGKAPYNNLRDEGAFRDHRYYPSQLAFDTSWDWLMPVVEKINRIKGTIYELPYDASFIIEDRKCSFYRFSFIGETTIESVYTIVSEFVRWYNDQVAEGMVQFTETIKT